MSGAARRRFTTKNHVHADDRADSRGGHPDRPVHRRPRGRTRAATARSRPVTTSTCADADRALERARAEDRGWDPALLEAAVREALARSHAGTQFEDLVLVLVDDRPGVHEDRAHYDAHAGGERVRVVLTRDEQGWRGETAT